MKSACLNNAANSEMPTLIEMQSIPICNPIRIATPFENVQPRLFDIDLPVAADFRARVLCGGDDAHGGAAIRHGPLRDHLPGIAQTSRLHHRRRHLNQQDGTRLSQGPPSTRAIFFARPLPSSPPSSYELNDVQEFSRCESFEQSLSSQHM